MKNIRFHMNGDKEVKSELSTRSCLTDALKNADNLGALVSNKVIFPIPKFKFTHWDSVVTCHQTVKDIITFISQYCFGVVLDENVFIIVMYIMRTSHVHTIP
jgi:hypothetical protein